MTILQDRNQEKLNVLAEIQKSIEQLTAQIELLNHKFIEETKFANAQANLTKQWAEKIAPLQELLNCACGVYQDEKALDDMLSDVEAMVNKARENFEANKKNPNRFLDEAKKVEMPSISTLKAEDKKEEAEVIEPVIAPVLPDENDDKTILTLSEITLILSSLEEKMIHEIRASYQISSKVTKIETIAGILSRKEITHFKLKSLINILDAQLKLRDEQLKLQGL